MAVRKTYTYTKNSLVEVIRRYCKVLSDRADDLVGDINGIQSITFKLPVMMDEAPRIIVEKTIVDRDAISAIRLRVEDEELRRDD